MLTGYTIADRVAYWLRQQGFDWIAGVSIVPMFSRGPQGNDDDAESSSTPLPKIVVSCANAEVVAPLSAGWTGELTVELYSNADDTHSEDHASHFSSVGELFMDTASASDALSLLDGIAVFQVVVRSQQDEFDARSWLSRLTVTIQAAERSVPAV